MDEKALGKQIKKYRKKIGYTQEQLAMQVNKNTIFKIIFSQGN